METKSAAEATLKNELDIPHWFVMKAGKKESLAMSVFEKAGLRAYCPYAKTTITVQGKKVITERPLIPNTVFVYSSFRVLYAVKNLNSFITYSYRKVGDGYRALQVPTHEMELFIASASKMQEDITYFMPNEVELKKGDKVRIIGGVFDGYEGVLLKAKGRGKRMFLINFEMLGALGTHIAPEYIQVIR